VDVRQVARDLGVRHVLDGSVRKSADRIRITTQLIDAATGAHVWAERYDPALEDIFAVQDEITLVLATEMQVRLTEGEQARLRYTTTANVQAWSQWVQGLSHYHRGALSPEGLDRALKCWQQASALDPHSASLTWSSCTSSRGGRTWRKPGPHACSSQTRNSRSARGSTPSSATISPASRPTRPRCAQPVFRTDSPAAA
jgi:hypothetical protein